MFAFLKKMHWSKNHKEFHLKAQCVTLKAIYGQYVEQKMHMYLDKDMKNNKCCVFLLL